MQMTLDSVVYRTEGQISTPLGPDLVILNSRTSNYVGFDEIGRRLWELLAVPGSVGGLCRKLSQEYQGDPREITSDILAFLNELIGERLIEVHDPSDAALK
jgi:Coenzyme PQQ synthesis protein D (PqqD)